MPRSADNGPFHDGELGPYRRDSVSVPNRQRWQQSRDPESPELGIARTGNRPSWESTELVAPAYFLTFPALTLLPAFRPSPIFFASSLRTAAYLGATIG